MHPSNTPSPRSSARSLRRLTAVACLLLGVVAGTAACGDDSSDKAGKHTTTTAKKSDTTRPSDASTTTVDAKTFDAAVSKANEALKASKTPCDVLLAVNEVGQLGNPTTQPQVRSASEFYAQLARSMAATTSDTTQADTLRKGADAFEAYGKANDWDPKKMRLDGAGPAIPEADSLQQSVSAYMSEAMTKCGKGSQGGTGSQGGAPSTTAVP